MVADQASAAVEECFANRLWVSAVLISWHMPIVSTGGRTVQTELARCAPNRDE